MTGWEFSEGVIAKARRYLDAEKIQRDATAGGVFWVKGSAERLYRVHTDADPERGTATWIDCSCAHGLNNGGKARCSHAVAVLLATRDRLEIPLGGPEA